MKLELLVFGYEDMATADKAFDKIIALEANDEVMTIDCGVIMKGRDGRASFHETEDRDTEYGVLLGMIAGGVIGMLGGPIGMFAGATAGAATGGVIANSREVGIPPREIRILKEEMDPLSSALVILTETDSCDAIIDGLAEFESTLARKELSHDFIDDLEKAHVAFEEETEAAKEKWEQAREEHKKLGDQ